MVNEWLGAYLFLRFFRYWGSKERKILIVSYIFVMFENKTKIFFQCGKRHKKNKEKIKYFIILVRTFLFVSFNPEGSDVHFMYYYKQHKSNRPLHCFACYLLPTNCKRKKVIYITKYPTNFEPCSSKNIIRLKSLFLIYIF